MEDFTLYLLKVSASIAAFYSLYYLLFRKEKQFVFNRVYLSSTLIISFLIPLITFKTEVPIVQSINSFPIDSISESNLNDIKYANQSIEITRFDLWTIIKMAYLFACFFLFLRLIFGIYKVKHIIKKGKSHFISSQKVIVTDKDICPFSFLNKIVIPENLINSKDLSMIIMHEKVHIKEKHFIDLHLSEILLLFLWFNPFSWLVNSAIRTNLEFSADEAIKNELYDLEEYQMAMVRLIDSKHISPLANALNVSQLKNRIMMMKRKKQKRYSPLKKLAVLPMSLTLILFLSAKQDVLVPIDAGEQIYIKGKVTEVDGERPIPWTTILVKEKPILVTITDNNGEFVLPAETSSKRLIISSFGYYSKEIEIGGRRTINIMLKSDDLIHEIAQPLNPVQGRNPRIDVNKQIVMVDNQENNIVIEGKIYGGLMSDVPVPWANVSVKGKTFGVVADEQGNYSIAVDKNEVLVFSSFGHFSKEIKIENQQEIDVKLKGIISISPETVYKLDELIYEQLKNKNKGFVIEGVVKSTQTKKPLSGVHVFIEGKPLGAITDDEGRYNIVVDKNDKQLRFSHLQYSSDFERYKSATAEIKNMKDQINVELESYRTMQEVTIYPENTEQISISGKITSAFDGSPIDGAFVIVKGKQIGAVTSSEGTYTISVYKNDEILEISAKGYDKKEILIGGKKNIDIYLDPVSSIEKIKVTGKVTETDSNKPIPGVAVVVKGTTIGAITDKEGNYTISFPEENDVLVFALMGYKLKEVEINDKERIDVSMDKEESPGVIINQLPDMPELGEIVLKGKVTESDSENALGGISVIIKGKPTGTMTDKDGNYQIHVSKDDNKLVFISPDYQTQEIDISEIKEIDVKLVKK